MCEHKNLRTVGDRLFCKDCKQELPLEFLLNQCKPEEPAEVIEEGNLEAVKDILDRAGAPILSGIGEDVSAIISEELSAMSAGASSPEDCAKKIQSRVSIWLSEHR